MGQETEGFGTRDTWCVCVGGGGQLGTVGKPWETGREGNVGTREWRKWVGRWWWGRGGERGLVEVAEGSALRVKGRVGKDGKEVVTMEHPILTL